MHVVEITNYINTNRRTESTPILYYQVSYRDVPSLRAPKWRTQEFCSGGGGSTNSVEDREKGDLGAVAP